MKFVKSQKSTPNGKRVFVDIDETICFFPDERRYDLAVPSYENISKINKLYDDNWYVVYWTARGGISGIDYYDFTKEQLNEWGCKYHEIVTGTSKHPKPVYDLVIDDKAKRIEEI